MALDALKLLVKGAIGREISQVAERIFSLEELVSKEESPDIRSNEVVLPPPESGPSSSASTALPNLDLLMHLTKIAIREEIFPLARRVFYLEELLSVEERPAVRSDEVVFPTPASVPSSSTSMAIHSLDAFMQLVQTRLRKEISPLVKHLFVIEKLVSKRQRRSDEVVLPPPASGPSSSTSMALHDIDADSLKHLIKRTIREEVYTLAQRLHSLGVLVYGQVEPDELMEARDEEDPEPKTNFHPNCKCCKECYEALEEMHYPFFVDSKSPKRQEYLRFKRHLRRCKLNPEMAVDQVLQLDQVKSFSTTLSDDYKKLCVEAHFVRLRKLLFANKVKEYRTDFVKNQLHLDLCKKSVDQVIEAHQKLFPQLPTFIIKDMLLFNMALIPKSERKGKLSKKTKDQIFASIQSQHTSDVKSAHKLPDPLDSKLNSLPFSRPFKENATNGSTCASKKCKIDGSDEERRPKKPRGRITRHSRHLHEG